MKYVFGLRMRLLISQSTGREFS